MSASGEALLAVYSQPARCLELVAHVIPGLLPRRQYLGVDDKLVAQVADDDLLCLY
jgi:hypothetical protein